MQKGNLFKDPASRPNNSALDFTKGKVKNLVWLYKSGSANYEASRDFAVNAYDNDRSSPFGDRNGCYPGCTKPLEPGDGNFTIRWSSYEEER